MTRTRCLACSLLAAATAGCVERRFLITSEVPGMPPGMDAGAMVSVNGKQEGPSPLDEYYIYYGKYHITLVNWTATRRCKWIKTFAAPWYEMAAAGLLLRENDLAVQGPRPPRIPLRACCNRCRACGRKMCSIARPGVRKVAGQTIVPLPDAIPQAPKPGPPPPPTIAGTGRSNTARLREWSADGAAASSPAGTVTII